MINDQRSQLQISKETGVDQTVISRLKNPDDVRDLNADITRRLALTYGVTADWLLGLPNAPKYPNTVNLDTLSYADICNIFLKLQSLGILTLYVKDYGMNRFEEYETDVTPEYDFQHFQINDALLCELLTEYEIAAEGGSKILQAYKAVFEEALLKIKLIDWSQTATTDLLQEEIAQHIKSNASRPKTKQVKILDNPKIRQIISDRSKEE